MFFFSFSFSFSFSLSFWFSFCALLRFACAILSVIYVTYEEHNESAKRAERAKRIKDEVKGLRDPSDELTEREREVDTSIVPP